MDPMLSNALPTTVTAAGENSITGTVYYWTASLNCRYAGGNRAPTQIVPTVVAAPTSGDEVVAPADGAMLATSLKRARTASENRSCRAHGIVCATIVATRNSVEVVGEVVDGDWRIGRVFFQLPLDSPILHPSHVVNVVYDQDGNAIEPLRAAPLVMPKAIAVNVMDQVCVTASAVLTRLAG
jgi:hypothetical protein